jgi:hypothetical protein
VQNRTYLDAGVGRRLSQNVLASDYRPKLNQQAGDKKLKVSLMEQSLQPEQEKLIASLRALVNDESLRAEQRLCVRCGAAMQYFDATFWLYETDLGWNVRLPFCPCEQKSTERPTSPVQTVSL